jgi:DNA replicative helicase MCM subunit Mcm2 (Cdc46/Mcm family)
LNFKQTKSFSTAIKEEHEEVKMNLEDLIKMVDMDQLRQFNPKLHEQLASNPEQLLTL